jgi:hypothetical protein
VKKSIDFAVDDHPEDDEDRPPAAWSVAVLDDCEPCGGIRIELTLEDVGRSGQGVVAHLAPPSARRLRTALATALREVGEEAGT